MGINLTSNQELEFITFSSAEYKIDSTKIIVPLKEINEIRSEKFDVQKSIFASVWIVIGITLALAKMLPRDFSLGG